MPSWFRVGEYRCGPAKAPKWGGWGTESRGGRDCCCISVAPKEEVAEGGASSKLLQRAEQAGRYQLQWYGAPPHNGICMGMGAFQSRELGAGLSAHLGKAGRASTSSMYARNCTCAMHVPCSCERCRLTTLPCGTPLAAPCGTPLAAPRQGSDVHAIKHGQDPVQG